MAAAKVLGLLPITHPALQHCTEAAAAAAAVEETEDRWWCCRCAKLLKTAAYYRHVKMHTEHLREEGEHAFWQAVDSKFRTVPHLHLIRKAV